jgi:5-methylcytosine-specific restriction endonuclease McrA
MTNTSVLLLNQNFTPLAVCSAKRAIIMVWTGKAEIIKVSGDYLNSISRSFVVPSIIRLLSFVSIARKLNIQLSKQNVLRRDNGVCQYCGKSTGRMTIDHVVPKSHGGAETWENLVCACPECNNSKGDRTLEEAGMELIRKPKRPSIGSILFPHRLIVHNSWYPFLN